MTIPQATSVERDPQRVHEYLPWYLNGTLAEADRVWLEHILRDRDGASEDLRRQLEFDDRVAAAFEQRLAEVPADIGWARLMQQVRADAAPPLAAEGMRGQVSREGLDTGSRGPKADSWLQRLSRLFAPTMSPRLGLALAVLVAAQTIAIGVLLSGREGGSDTVEYRSSDGARPMPAIRALLNEQITEKALREALTASGATIVDGPNALGEYWIVAGSTDPEAVAVSLRQAGVIASHVIDYRAQGR
ncbi:MAG TPA: hypothetical protein VEY69_11860 [Lautropia sp.]|nr:hypothetical protein [Lautropia sp.]